MNDHARLNELEERLHRLKNGGYLHREALCLMKYATRDGSEVEWIWNSRDGVTPFVVHSRSGQEMSHVQWQFDVRVPNYQPLLGERIFVDITPGYAELLAHQKVDLYWSDPDYPMSQAYETKAEAVEAMTSDLLGDGDRPTLIEVAEWQQARAASKPGQEA
jgi:hypothetical protein